MLSNQRWSRGHKARGQGQGHKKKSEAKAKAKDSLSEDRHSRGQGQECSRPRPRTKDTKRKCSPKKKKRSSQKFFKRSPLKNVFQKIFQALHKILTFQKIVLSSSRGQANFRGLEAKDFKMCPRGRPRGQGRPRGLHLCLKLQNTVLKNRETKHFISLLLNDEVLLLQCYSAEVESLRTSLVSRRHFEVLGLEASSPRKMPCSRLEESSIF